MANRKISVIIPVYNTGSDLLIECINSCLNQTFADFDICIVNDGSTLDSTLVTLNDLSLKYPKIIKIFDISNSGAALARQYALKNSLTEFIFFLDADDYLEKSALFDLIERQSITDYDIVVGQANLILDNSIKPAKKYDLEMGRINPIKAFLVNELPITLWGNLYHRSLFEDVIFYDFTVGEDMVINAQIFSKPDINVSVIPSIIYNYRQHDLSLTKQISPEKTKQGYLAHQKTLSILEKASSRNELTMEFCLSRLNTFYAAIILNAEKEIIKAMIFEIKIVDAIVRSNALSHMETSKRLIVMIVLKLPSLYGPLKTSINFLRR